jgi:hypothetical protein
MMGHQFPSTLQSFKLQASTSTPHSMPFSTDTNWPQGLIDVFDACRKTHNPDTPSEYRYYAAYDRLLNHALIQDSGFTFLISFQTKLAERSRSDPVESDYFIVVLDLEQKPVLIVDFKDDKWANDPDRRQRADILMRDRYNQMLYSCPLPQLYGLSLLGTSLRVYCGDKAACKVTPQFSGRPDRHQFLPRDFLEGLWDVDILSQDGFLKMKEIVSYITANVKANVVGQ